MEPNLDLRQIDEPTRRWPGVTDQTSRRRGFDGNLGPQPRLEASANTKDFIRLHWPTEAFQGERTQIASFNDRLDLGEDALTNDDLA